MAGIVAVLLVFLSALPDDAPAMSSSPASSHGRGSVSMEAASPNLAALPFTVASASPADADVPPGDGRVLTPALPVILRLPVPAGHTAAVNEPPSPIGSALPERPPKAV